MVRDEEREQILTAFTDRTMRVCGTRVRLDGHFVPPINPHGRTDKRKLVSGQRKEEGQMKDGKDEACEGQTASESQRQVQQIREQPAR